MSLARSAMPSSRIFAPSLTSAYTQRCTISSSEIARGATSISARYDAIRRSISGSGSGVRLPGSYRYQPLAVFWPSRPISTTRSAMREYVMCGFST